MILASSHLESAFSAPAIAFCALMLAMTVGMFVVWFVGYDRHADDEGPVEHGTRH